MLANARVNKSRSRSMWGYKKRLFFILLILVILTSCAPSGNQTQIIPTPTAQPQIPDCKGTETGFCWPTGIDFSEYTKSAWLTDSCDLNNKHYIFDNRYHIGWDIPAKVADKVYAITEGEMFYVNEGSTWGTGNVGVFIKHKLEDGREFLALYGHVKLNTGLLERFKKDKHLSVQAGESFATIGSYSGGNHLHFGIVDGTTVPPTNTPKGIGWGMMPCPNNGNYNSFTDPLEWITKNSPFGSNVLGASTTQEAIPTPTQISSELPPLNRQDYYSVLQWIKYALANNDVSVFEELVKGDLGRYLFRVNVQTQYPVTRKELLNDLITRLPSIPYCDRYAYSGDWLSVWTDGWSPNWGKTGTSAAYDSINFTFHKEADGWMMILANFGAFGETPKAYFNRYNFTDIKGCDNVPLPSVSVPAPVSIKLDQSDLSSVLRLLKYAIDNRDLNLIEPLIGNDGVGIAIYASEFDRVGYDNSDEFIPLLSKALGNNNFVCLGYNNTPSYSAQVFFKGNVDWTRFPKKTNEDSNGIVFGFVREEQKWELLYVTKLPSYVLSYSPDYDCQSFGSVSSTTNLAPLNRSDYYSVLQWIKYAFLNNDMFVFKELVTGDLAYVSYIEGYDPLTRSEFLNALETRLPSSPYCDSFMIYSDGSGDRLDILSTGWSPMWTLDQICHAGCDQINPPATSDVIAFALINEGTGWHIDAVPFGPRPDWFARTVNAQVVSCDTVQISPSTTSSSISSNLPPLNRADYYSVLQWIKYASLYNDISVFENLIIGNSIQSFDGNDSPVTINKADFLAELSKRLLNKPNCEFFMFEESGRLVIRISGWLPGWGVDGDTVVYLILETRNNQWVLTSIVYGDHLPSWAQGLERISYDTISLSAGITTDAVCKEARPTRLKIGDFAFISFYPPLNQRVRSGPGTSNSILDVIPVGTAVKILDGPQCADNWVWWKVRVLSSKLEGWTSEGDKDAYWLIPCESRNNCGTR